MQESITLNTEKLEYAMHVLNHYMFQLNLSQISGSYNDYIEDHIHSLMKLIKNGDLNKLSMDQLQTQFSNNIYKQMIQEERRRN